MSTGDTIDNMYMLRIECLCHNITYIILCHIYYVLNVSVSHITYNYTVDGTPIIYGICM